MIATTIKPISEIVLLSIALLLSSCTSMKSRLSKMATRTLGNIYLRLEKNVEYEDAELLGVEIDEDLQQMSREELCAYIDGLAGTNGFYKLDSTSKIRLGAQLFRNASKAAGTLRRET